VPESGAADSRRARVKKALTIRGVSRAAALFELFIKQRSPRFGGSGASDFPAGREERKW
jgi:hypothetical protein